MFEKEIKKIKNKKSFQVPFRSNLGWSIPKKIEKSSKTKKRYSGIISSQTEPGQAEKEIKNFSF